MSIRSATGPCVSWNRKVVDADVMIIRYANSVEVTVVEKIGGRPDREVKVTLDRDDFERIVQ